MQNFGGVNKVHYGLCENGESDVSLGIKIHHLTQMVVIYWLLTKGIIDEFEK